MARQKTITLAAGATIDLQIDGGVHAVASTQALEIEWGTTGVFGLVANLAANTFWSGRLGSGTVRLGNTSGVESLTIIAKAS